MRGKKRIMIIGGTGEARRLAAMLVQYGYSVVTSLAGVTTDPALPTGEVRFGGFGSIDGMVEFIQGEGIMAIADASHPFAVNITKQSFEAAKRCNLPYVRLDRRPWKPLAGEQWQMLENVEVAVKALPQNARVLLTIGRKDLPKFAVRDDLSVLARSIEPPDMELPPNWKFIEGRPPFSIESEMELMDGHKIDCLLSKNSGGKAVAAKLQAARELGVRIFMIERPVIEGIRKVRKVDQVLQFLPKL